MNKEKKAVKNKNTHHYITLANRAVSLLVIACGVLYLAGTNDLAIKHFVVQENKRKLFNLKEENMELETQVMTLGSLTTINKKVASLKMVKSDQVDYLNLSSAVAKR